MTTRRVQVCGSASIVDILSPTQLSKQRDSCRMDLAYRRVSLGARQSSSYRRCVRGLRGAGRPGGRASFSRCWAGKCSQRWRPPASKHLLLRQLLLLPLLRQRSAQARARRAAFATGDRLSFSRLLSLNQSVPCISGVCSRQSTLSYWGTIYNSLTTGWYLIASRTRNVHREMVLSSMFLVLVIVKLDYTNALDLSK